MSHRSERSRRDSHRHIREERDDRRTERQRSSRDDDRRKPRNRSPEYDRNRDRRRDTRSVISSDRRDRKRPKDDEVKISSVVVKNSENLDPNSTKAGNEKESGEIVPPKKKKDDEMLTTRTGGAYIPPAKLRMMQAKITDKTSPAYQRLSWEALKKSINGLINKVNVSNISIIVRELFRENIIRGRGLLARSIMQAQAASPTFTHVYASFVSIINSKFPQIGELILKRLILQFRRGFYRNLKANCISATRFIGHLVNQQVAHEILALEILTLLMESPTDDSVEVAIGFLKECGMKLTEVSPRGLHGVFERLRSILHEGNVDIRVRYMIEVMFAIRKDGFKDHQSILTELDIVFEEDQFTHMITLDEDITGDDVLNVFKFDPAYQETEDKYKKLRKEILEEETTDEEGSEGEEKESDDEEEEDEEEDGEEAKVIIDKTETNLVSLRRTIYLTIQSSLDFEECAHKLLKMELKPGQEVELCHMILDCCAQQRTYEKFYGLLAQRFCQLNKIYIAPYETIFVDSYDTIHRLETNKLRNVAKFFAHLLYTDAIGWMVLSHIRLNEEDTTSSSRIFIKILFQELSEYMGLPHLNGRLKDVTLQEAFDGLFPRDNPRNTRFAINFFTSIGLGGLTDELREHLKSQPKPVTLQQIQPEQSESDDTESSSDTEESDENSSEDSSSDSSSSSESSEAEEPPRRHARDKKKSVKTSRKKTPPKQSKPVKEKQSRPPERKTREKEENRKRTTSSSHRSSHSDHKQKIRRKER